MDLFKWLLSEEDFDGAPETDEGDAIYQFLFIGKKIYFRNIDTGEITVSKV